MKRRSWTLVKNLLSTVEDKDICNITYPDYMTRLKANLMCIDAMPCNIPSDADWKQLVNEDILESAYHNHLPAAEAEIQEDELLDDAPLAPPIASAVGSPLAQPLASPQSNPIQLLFPPVIRGMIQKIQRVSYEQGELEHVEQIRSNPIYFVVYIACFISTTWKRWLELERSLRCIKDRFLQKPVQQCVEEPVQQDILHFALMYTICNIDLALLEPFPMGASKKRQRGNQKNSRKRQKTDTTVGPSSSSSGSASDDESPEVEDAGEAKRKEMELLLIPENAILSAPWLFEQGYTQEEIAEGVYKLKLKGLFAIMDKDRIRFSSANVPQFVYYMRLYSPVS